MIVKDIIQPVVTDIVYGVTGPLYLLPRYEWLKTAGGAYIRGADNEIIIIKVEYEWLETADNDYIRDPDNEIITIKVE